MKHTKLALSVLVLGLAAGFFLHTPHAAALAKGSCPGAGTNDQCTVLLVTLTGKSIPSTGVTVEAKRQDAKSGYDDNDFFLNGASDASAFPNNKPSQDWTGRNSLGTNQYTSYYGVFFTLGDLTSGQCDPTHPQQTSFTVIVGGSAGVTGTSSPQYIDLCRPGASSDGAFVKSINVAVNTASNPATNGGIKGTATYYNSISGQTGNCTTDSILQVYGGPDNISQNAAKKVSIASDGSFQSPLEFKPGKNYTVDMVCYDGPLSNPAVGVYHVTKPGITITANALTTIDLSDTGLTITGGGQQKPPPSNSSSQGPTPSCETTGFSMAWIMCEVIDGLANTIDSVYLHVILPMLTTPGLGTDTASGSHIYAAWSTFRVYGDLFLIIALMVIVFGQAIGGGLVDAYTAKKVLPRLLAAAVLINLSFFIVTIAVDISNIIGTGIGTLITHPFNLDSAKPFDLSSLNGSAQATVGLLGSGAGATGGIVAGSFIVGAGTVGAATGAALSLLWSVVLLPALLVFVAIMCTLIIRLGLIYILILFAPVAFALYALPNTEQYFRRWWDTLFRTLLVFPIISVLFAVSKVMAQTTIWATGSSGVTGGFAYILSLFILILPLIGIPFAFKLAGGILGRISDVAHGARGKISQAGFLKRGRDRALQRAQVNRANGTSRMISGVGNTGAGRWLRNNGVTGNFARRTVEGADQRSRTLAAELAKDPRSQALKDDDNALRAQTYRNAAEAYEGVRQHLINTGMGAADAEAEARRSVSAAQASTGFGRAQAINAAQRMVDTGTAVSNIDDMTSIISRASGGNDSTIAGLAGYANSVTKGIGRHDLAPSFATLRDHAMTKAHGGTVSTAEQHEATRRAWNSVDPGTAVRSKTREIETFAQHFSGVMNDAHATFDERRDAAIALSELQGALPGATADNQRHINEALAAVGFDATSPDSVEEQLAFVVNAAAGPGAPTLTGVEIGNVARKYSQVPYAARGGGVPPPPGAGGGGPAGP